MPPERDTIDAALLELARPDGAADLGLALGPLGDRRQARFLELVLTHRLEASLVDCLGRAGQPVPPDVQGLVDDHRYTRLRIASVLQQVAEALTDIPWLVFKGPVVSSLMSRPELRIYNDLDVLVGARRFGDAIDALGSVGIEELNTNWTPYLRYRVGEVPLAAGDITVDLHWDLVGLDHVRRDLGLTSEPMLERRRWTTLGTRRVPVFDAEDRLIQLASHSALGGGSRIDQLRDIAVVVGSDGPLDWDEVKRRARTARVARLVAHALDRAEHLFNVGIPAAVVSDLGGPSVHLRRRLDGATISRLRKFPVASIRDTSSATLRCAGRRLGQRAIGAMGLERGWDFTDERSRLYFGRPSGGRAERARYLEVIGSLG